jgi:hypothetical protein
MKRTARRPSVTVTNGGKGVVVHVGARLLCELADDLSLTEQLSVAMAPTKKRRRGHDRGEVLVDLAVALADGATTILRVLSDQPGLFGEVASVPRSCAPSRPSTRELWPASLTLALRRVESPGRPAWTRAST